jgi:hypothetical protein
MGELLLKGNLKPNKIRAEIAIIFIWIVLAIQILWLIWNGVMIISTEAASLKNSMQGIFKYAVGIAGLISAIAYIQWFRRAYYNLHIKINDLTYTESWAEYCWYVPIINWYMPYKIMKELYYQIENLLSKRIDNFTKLTTSSLIGWWWTLWMTLWIIGIIIFIISFSFHQLIILTVLSLMESIMMIPLAPITIKLIKNYSTYELLLYDLEDENI